MYKNKKIALVTGSSRGIGLAIAKKLIDNSFFVIINNSKDKVFLSELATSLGDNCYPITCNISNYDEISKMVSEVKEKFGSIDVLVNNAGIAYHGLLQDMDITDFKNVMETNLNSAFYTSKNVIGDMISQKEGSIINISSIWGISGASCETVYSASKGGLNSFTKALAKELAPSNVRVNAIACGVIDTDMNNNLSCVDKECLEYEIPYSRFGKAEEVADLCFYLASGSPHYLTGQIITLDGGLI